MKPVLVDTDILSMFFRNSPNVVSNFKKYLSQYEKINLSIITYYEILSGLKHKDALKQMALFLEFVKHNTILPLTEDSVTISSGLYANLRKKGNPIDDIDILIAGVKRKLINSYQKLSKLCPTQCKQFLYKHYEASGTPRNISHIF